MAGGGPLRLSDVWLQVVDCLRPTLVPDWDCGHQCFQYFPGEFLVLRGLDSSGVWIPDLEFDFIRHVVDIRRTKEFEAAKARMDFWEVEAIARNHWFASELDYYSDGSENGVWA